MNMIEEQVLPLKNEAIEKALAFANEMIEKCEKELKEANNDLRVVAPYPNSFNETKLSFQSKVSRYRLFTSLCKSRKSSIKSGEPRFADIDNEKVNKFRNVVIEDTAAEYDAFVQKLVKKIGEVKEAKLEGNHVWGYSLLNVITESGEKQIWKTNQIINVSKYGKLFNQWPTRKVKGKT